MEHGSKTRLLTAFVLGVVFGAGILIGLAADSNLGAAAAATVVETEADGGEEERPRRQPIWTQMGPTPEQEARIDSIVAVHRRRTSALDKETRAAYQEGFRQIVLETREAIKTVFTPQQAAQYQELLDEFDARREEERRNERENGDQR